jgi:hypothetical protein
MVEHVLPNFMYKVKVMCYISMYPEDLVFLVCILRVYKRVPK